MAYQKVELGEDREPTVREEARMRKKLYKSIARSLESKIKSVTDISLGRFPATIEDIQIEEDRLMILIGIPFLLPPAAPEPDKLTLPRREKELIRKQFVKYLRKKENEKQMSNFFHTQLVRFLIGICTSKKYSPEIVKHLRRISQRNLAGRPPQVLPPKALRYIRAEGGSIKSAILDMQSLVQAMKRRTKDLTDTGVLEMLGREFPSSKYTWMPSFLAIKDKLPRKRYESSGITDRNSVESDSEGNLPPCSLSEPENWWTLEIATRIIQEELFAETKDRYPLQAIRNRLKSK